MSTEPARMLPWALMEPAALCTITWPWVLVMVPVRVMSGAGPVSTWPVALGS